jgi:hypothetical protein
MNEKGQATLKICEQKLNYLNYSKRTAGLLKYVGDNDGYGFWYAVDSNGKRISNDLKGGIFESLFADGIITLPTGG